MSMNRTVYLITGYKTTRDELREKYADIFDRILDNEPDGIVAVQSEGCDDVIIGRVNNKNGEYDDKPAELVTLHSVVDVVNALNGLGLTVEPTEVKHWFYGTWG